MATGSGGKPEEGEPAAAAGEDQRKRYQDLLMSHES